MGLGEDETSGAVMKVDDSQSKERFALLFNKFNSIEVMVSSDVHDYNRRIKKNGIGKVVGSIKFETNRTAWHIAQEFKSIYTFGKEINDKNLSKNSSLLEYPMRFNDTLSSAFVTYFSPSNFAEDDYDDKQ